MRKSKKIASLSPETLALFCLLIPHFNAHGKMNGDINFIKGEVCPLIKWLTLSKIKSCLLEISIKTNVKWFESDGLKYLHSLKWHEHQYLREDRMVEDSLPSYKDMTSPVQVPDLPCIEVEVEGKEEGKGESRRGFDFESLFSKYPNTDGKGKSLKKLQTEIKTPEDFALITKALDNYLASKRVREGTFVKNCSTFFNNWRDWINHKEVNKTPVSRPLVFEHEKEIEK